jgi:hypothetical protein
VIVNYPIGVDVIVGVTVVVGVILGVIVGVTVGVGVKLTEVTGFSKTWSIDGR